MIMTKMMMTTRLISVRGMVKRRLMLRKSLGLGSGEATTIAIATAKRGVGLICHLSVPAPRPRPRLLEKSLLDVSRRHLLL